MALFDYAIPNSVYGSISGFGMPPASAAAPLSPTDPTAYAMPQSGFTAGWNGQALPGMTPGQQLTPGMPVQGQPGWGARTASWLGNSQNLASVFQGISALTGAYFGFQQLKQAKDALSLQKRAFETNLRNSTQAYNTSLEDRIRGRTSNYDGKENDVQSYLAANRLGGG